MTSVKIRIFIFTMIMAYLFVHKVQIPYLSFLMGGLTVTLNNFYMMSKGEQW